MTLENYIYESIYCYPNLFYHSDFQKSRLIVMDHLFLSLGNGMHFNKKGFMEYSYRGERKRDLPITQIKRRLRAGERIVDVYNTKTYSTHITGFVNDVDLSDIDDKQHAIMYYPDDNERKYKHRPDTVLTPYPFCFYYLPFVEINPYYNDYNYNTIGDMTVGELRESIPLIRKDWLAGIVETFKWALDFFESEKFYNDNHYNWVKSYVFPNWIKRFNENIKNSLMDYKIPLEMADKSTEDIAKFLVERSKIEYISNCKRILQAFE